MVEVSRPLEEDPNDLANIHRPTFKELVMESFEGIPLRNRFINSIVQGDDGRICVFCTEYNSKKRTWFIEMGLIRGNTGLKLLEGVHWPGEKAVVNRAMDKIEFLSAEGGWKYTIEEDEYSLHVDRMFGKNKVLLNLKFSDLRTPFWYNKGKIAIFPGGMKIYGFEQISTASGYGVFDGERVNLQGFANHEFLFNTGCLLKDLQLKYGGEFWMPFSCEKICGIFTTLQDYREAYFIINDEYLIPTKFEIKVIRWLNQFPIDVSASAKTRIGTLNVDYHAIGTIGTIWVPSKVVSTFKDKDGQVTKLDGFGWIEFF